MVLYMEEYKIEHKYKRLYLSSILMILMMV